jgi:hypothetical protein
MDLVDWLLVHDRWLHSRLGAPDGPSSELVAAWDRADWWKVFQLCDEWTREVEIGPLRQAQNDAEREQVEHGLLIPISLVKNVATTMPGGAEYARGMQRGMAQGGLNQLESVLDSVFTSYAQYGMPAWLENVFVGRVEQLVAIFVNANDNGVDLSVSRADIEASDPPLTTPTNEL